MLCDETLNPIVGYRYTKKGSDPSYDLCQSAFDKLPMDDRASFERIAPPITPRRTLLGIGVLAALAAVLPTTSSLRQQTTPDPMLFYDDFIELPPLSPAEQLVAFFFRPKVLATKRERGPQTPRRPRPPPASAAECDAECERRIAARGAEVRWTSLRRLRGGFHPALTAALHGYNSALAAAPLATNAASAASLAVVSDSIAQVSSSSSSAAAWDFERSAWMAVWGALASGVLIFYWLRFLAMLFPQARTSAAQLVGKVFVNQLVMSPGLNGGFFAFVIWTRTAPRLVMTAAKRRLLVDKYRADLVATCARSCAFWSIVQAINFRYLPLQYSVLFTNAAFVIWTTYLSLVGNR